MQLNNRGTLTVDVIFGITITTGIMMIVFAFCYALSVAEIVQYIAFASSRSYFAGNVNQDDQQNAGQTKFSNLRSNSPTKGITSLLNKNWFSIKANVSDFSQDYNSPAPLNGTQILVNMLFLDFNAPVFGSTTGDGGGAFQTKINSFLGREPTSYECTLFFQQKWSHILGQSPNASGLISGSGGDSLQLDDNGC